MTIEQATASAGKSIKSYEYYRRTDKIFADKVDRTRLGLKDKQFAGGDVHDIDFVEFRKRFLHSQTFEHQTQHRRCNRRPRTRLATSGYEV
jgi:hypothetical protein